MQKTARTIISETGVHNVLVKGGHGMGNKMNDLLVCDTGRVKLYINSRIDTPNTHGTGCTLSSAIAAYLGMGHPLRFAIGHAIEFVHRAILNAKFLETGHGHGSLNHLFHPKRMIMVEK